MTLSRLVSRSVRPATSTRVTSGTYSGTVDLLQIGRVQVGTHPEEAGLTQPVLPGEIQGAHLDDEPGLDPGGAVGIHGRDVVDERGGVAPQGAQAQGQALAGGSGQPRTDAPGVAPAAIPVG